MHALTQLMTRRKYHNEVACKSSLVIGKLDFIIPVRR